MCVCVFVCGVGVSVGVLYTACIYMLYKHVCLMHMLYTLCTYQPTLSLGFTTLHLYTLHF